MLDVVSLIIMQKAYLFPLFVVRKPASELASPCVPVLAFRLFFIGSIRCVSVPSPGDGRCSNTLLSLFLTRYSEIKSALIKLFFETPLASVIRILEVSSPSFLQ